MNCIQNFTLSYDLSRSFNILNTNVRCWTAGTQNFWTARFLNASVYDVQGFKNINIYKVKLQAYITPIITSITGAIVEDYSLAVEINGTAPILGGNFSTNSYNGTTTNQPYLFTKNNSEIEFASPITSVKFIKLGDISVQGYGWQLLNDIDLQLQANMIVYYDFEGE
jgi:hypothetical protein